MKEVQVFLESSSIAGLNQIATSKKHARLFWILAVFSGFTGAGYLIHMSFHSWSLSPVTTTVETLPLSMMKLPKVTVCPPKNTFTDLNYDLMRAENLGIGDEQINQLFDSALELLESRYFAKNWDRWNMVQEENRFFNWYHGYTKIAEPFYFKTIARFDVETSAQTGSVTSQHFGNIFNLTKIEKNFYHKIQILTPNSIKSDSNVSLHIKFEQTKGFNHSIKDDENGKIIFDTNNSYAYTPIDFDYQFTIERKMGDLDLEKLELLLMPGYKFSWFISGANLTQDEPLFYDPFNRMKKFIR